MRNPERSPVASPKHGLARALSKLGHCSRSQAFILIRNGRVSLNGHIIRNPECPVAIGRDRIEVDGALVETPKKIYLMLNKPRGLVTTADDEQGRATVYQCLGGFSWLAPVGRLDKASEGLLLFSNDTAWANGITDPKSHLDKVYHVQIRATVEESLLRRLQQGVRVEDFLLKVKRVSALRSGEKNSWLEIVLDEGRNRHIRNLLGALGIEILRLIRISIGPVALGDLPKGQWRDLTQEEVSILRGR